MAAAKKATAKKATAKTTKSTPVKKPTSKSTAKKVTGAKTAAATAPLKPIKEALKKNALVAAVAERSGVDVKAARKLFAALEEVIAASVNKKGAGLFILPGYIKVAVVKVPAKPAREAWNPLTKQKELFKAKPASTRLRIRGLKKLKDAALK